MEKETYKSSHTGQEIDYGVGNASYLKITSPSTDQVLRYNGEFFVNDNPVNLNLSFKEDIGHKVTSFSP